MRRMLILSLALIVLLATAVGCTAQTGLKTVRLHEVTHSVFYAPQYIAINLGFFEKEGLKIELTNAGGADKAMTALLADQADVAFCGPEAAVYVSNEKRNDPAVIFAQLTSCDGSFLLARTPEPDFSWASLKGKHILAGRKGGIPCMTLAHVIAKNGVDPYTETNFDTSVQYNLMGGAFLGGAGDYVTLFEPAASEMELAGQATIVASVGEASGEIPYTTYIAKKSNLTKQSDMLVKFTRAIIKGQEWVATHTPEEIAKELMPSFEGSKLDVLTAVAKRYRDIGAWKTSPVMSQAAYDRLLDVMTEAGELKAKPEFKAVVDNAIAEKAMKK